MSVNYRVLQDQIGNLLSRIASPRILANMVDFTPEDRDIAVETKLSALRDTVQAHMEVYAVSKACDSVLDVIATVSPSSRTRTFRADRVLCCIVGKQVIDDTATVGFSQPHQSDRVRL